MDTLRMKALLSSLVLYSLQYHGKGIAFIINLLFIPSEPKIYSPSVNGLKWLSYYLDSVEEETLG